MSDEQRDTASDVDQEDTLGGIDQEDTVEGVDLAPAMAVSTPTGSFEDFPPPAAQAGDILAGRYRLEAELARRGGTLTWRAFDQKLSRSVLVHLMAADDPRTEEVLEAARKAATATDSRFLRVLDAVPSEDAGGASLVVCEFAPGESLEKLLRQGPLSALEAAWVARELADALSVMHAEGLFHQRLNPDTVIITATGNVKIVGFLIEAALHPDAEQGTLAWSEREAADVSAIGKVLYASLVTRWPTPSEELVEPDGTPTRRWGMAAAPFDKRGWLTPRQVRSGVSPALDTICDQILSAAPRNNEMPIRTASQLVGALNKVLGTADASPDLERRLRFPIHSLDEDTANQPALEPTGRVVANAATSRLAAVDGARPGEARPAPGPSSGGPVKAPRPSGSVLARPRPRPTNRRWLVLLVGFVAFVLVVSLVRVALRQAGGEQAPEQPQAPTVHKVVRAVAFDPVSDGGDGKENSDQAGLAIDGKAETAWQTDLYLGQSKMGGLKPGVGLLLDLGEKRTVGEVKVTLQGAPTAVELRVPEDPETAKAPTNSVKSWNRVAAEPKASTSVVLRPGSTTQTRYLLVYVSNLPQVQAKKFRARIAEIEVHG